MAHTSDGRLPPGVDELSIAHSTFRDAAGVETIPEDEAEKIKLVSEQFNRFQMMNFNEHHHCLRGTHLKTQGV